jgi:hypothetical protein
VTIHRRTFLKRALGGAGALVLLPRLEAFATTSTPRAPLRYLTVMVPNGMIIENWRPAKTGPLDELSPTLQPLADWKNQICVLGGLDNYSAEGLQDGPGDHARGTSTYLTCRRLNKSETDIRAGQSIDQIIATQVGGASRYPSINVSGDDLSFPDSGYSQIYTYSVSWANATTPTSNEYSPRKMFDRMFKGTDAATTAQQIKLRLRNRLSVLDYVREEANTLTRRLGSSDRRRLDQYLQSVREVEKRVQVQADGELNGKVCPMNLNVPENTEFNERLRLFSDLLVLTFQCDLSRVATFIVAPEASERAYPFIGIESGHHSLTHHAGDKAKIAKVAKINRFHTEQLAYLLGRLQSVTEGEGTLFDATHLLYGANITDGNVHNHDDLPILVSGATAKLFKPGHYVRFPKQTPLANLHVRMAQAMGANVTSFADSSGAL